MFIDTHAHIYNEYYVDKSLVINRAKEEKVNLIINNGVDQKSNEEVLANVNANVYGALGIHPESVLDYTLEDIEFIKKNLSNPYIVAIGEIGLDYHYGKENRLEQIKLFELQLKIAEDYHLPVIIHSRDATEDTINTLKKYHVKGVIHSFSGSFETANIYLKMGFLLGINGVVTFKNAHLIEALKKLDLNSFVLETDSPYLTPEPYRGKTNEPANIYYIAKYLEKNLDIPLAKIASITSANAMRTFDKLPQDAIFGKEIEK